MKVGEPVEITDASSRYRWKRELVGKKGTIDEATETAVAIRIKGEEGKVVWFAKDCVRVMP